tara:strand:- start:4837 stop:5811 length:975 start_codon:yes stop_codon:yes gene_type:complete
MIFKAAKDMVKHFNGLDSQARDVAQSMSDNRSIKERHLSQVSRLRSEALTQVVNAGLQAGDCVPATNLARRASDVFKDPDHLKAARASYDFVMSIGGIDKLEEYKKKSEAIQDRKLDDSLLEYTEVLDKYKMVIGSVIMMVWSCGSKSFVRVVDRFSDSNLSTSICVQLLVNSKEGKAMYTIVPIVTVNAHCTIATGANLQKLFDDVCEGDNIKKLYELHVDNTPLRSRYSEHDFARAVVQQSRDGIEESPGLTRILARCGSSDPAMSNKQGKMPMDASSLKKLADAASQAKASDESDDEPTFVQERTREDRDRQGRLEAICLE